MGDGAATLALCALEFTFHVSGDLRAFLNDWVYDNIMFAAGAACLARGIALRRDRLAWILMGLAVMSWGAGDTVWTITIGDDPSPPAPSFADLGYLAVYPSPTRRSCCCCARGWAGWAAGSGSTA